MKETIGTVIAARKQWWLKVNTQPIRKHMMDGAVFPYVIQVRYEVSGETYYKRKWISAGKPVPPVDSTVAVLYDEKKPAKAKIF